MEKELIISKKDFENMINTAKLQKREAQMQVIAYNAIIEEASRRYVELEKEEEAEQRKEQMIKG